MLEVVAAGRSEDRREPLDRAEDREPDDRCNQRGDQGVGLDVLPIQDLRAKDRAT
jgi:hypothetical protein